METKRKVLLGLTGSVATIKADVIVEELKSNIDNVEIAIIATKSAMHFLPQNISDLGVTIYCDQDEWDSWKGRGDPVLHIELRKWADVFLIGKK